ncbi:MAG: hypothetical protein AAGC55_01865 [Myxococcota bacterium]
MKIRLNHRFTITATLSALALGLGACAADSADDATADSSFDDAEVIAQALELDNGGLDMADELRVFNDEATFDRAELGDEMPYTDAVEDTEEVRTMLGDVDAVLFSVTIGWGAEEPGADNTPYNWSGTISVNRGGLIVRAAMAFDGVIDQLEPRDNPQSISFRSVTLPHRDGLRLLVVDPDPAADEPLVITYTQIDGDTFSMPMAALLGGPVFHDMDDAGHQMFAMAMAQPLDVCEHGFLGGRWHKVAEHRGRILGRVVDAEGTPIGHMRGLYGQRADGDKVFFIKYINNDGEFRGILRGTYGAGNYLGRWMTRTGERGTVAGAYRETVPGPRIGGHFIGRWAETTCNLTLDR